jgi:hypothetical protein
MNRAINQHVHAPRSVFGISVAAAAVAVILVVAPHGAAVALGYLLLSATLAAMPAWLVWYFSFNRRVAALVFCCTLIFIIAGSALFASGSGSNQPGVPAVPAGTR